MARLRDGAKEDAICAGLLRLAKDVAMSASPFTREMLANGAGADKHEKDGRRGQEHDDAHPDGIHSRVVGTRRGGGAGCV